MNETTVFLRYRSGERFSATLVEQATLTDRVFPGSWHNAAEGDRYEAEYSAVVVVMDDDEEGEEYLSVVWRFNVIRGQEPEDDCLPWEDTRYVYSAEYI